jgi:hypothetical protein
LVPTCTVSVPVPTATLLPPTTALELIWWALAIASICTS